MVAELSASSTAFCNACDKCTLTGGVVLTARRFDGGGCFVQENVAELLGDLLLNAKNTWDIEEPSIESYDSGADGPVERY